MGVAVAEEDDMEVAEEEDAMEVMAAEVVIEEEGEEEVVDMVIVIGDMVMEGDIKPGEEVVIEAQEVGVTVEVVEDIQVAVEEDMKEVAEILKPEIETILVEEIVGVMTMADHIMEAEIEIEDHQCLQIHFHQNRLLHHQEEHPFFNEIGHHVILLNRKLRLELVLPNGMMSGIR